MKWLLGWLLALLVAPMAHATVVPTPPSAASQAAKEAVAKHTQSSLDAYMAEIARFVQPQEKLTTDTIAVVTAVMDGADKAFELFDAKAGRQRARAWSMPWREAQQSAFSILKVRAASLPDFKIETLTRLGADDQLKEQIRVVQQLPSAIRAGIEESEQASLRFMGFAARTAEGDNKAADAMPAEIIRLSTVLIDVENRQLELSLAGIRPGHPQRAVTRSGVALNHSMIALLKGMVAGLTEDDVTRATHLAEARRRIVEAQAATAEVNGAAEKMKSLLLSVDLDELAPEQHAKLVKMMDSYGPSAQVELKMADTMSKAVDHVASGDPEAMATVNQLLTELEELTTERLRIHAARLDGLAQ